MARRIASNIEALSPPATSEIIGLCKMQLDLHDVFVHVAYTHT